ncbi:MAG: diaminopimelate decarboxylase [archaeon]
MPKKTISKKYLRPRWNYLSQTKGGVLIIDGVSAKDIAEKYGTPVYVFVEREIRNRMRRFKKAFPYQKLRVQLAGKTNSNLEILKIAREEGLEFDASSVGEIILGLLADFKPKQITFTNLYKTEQDIMFAAKIGVQAITADSFQELRRINNAGKKLGVKIRTFMRINPMIDYRDYTTRNHQYGIPHSYAKKNIDYALESKHIDLIGFHFHGSYIKSPRIYYLAAQKLMNLAKYARDRGANIRYIDLGGGFPVEWGTKSVFQPEDMGEDFVKYFQNLAKGAGFEDLKLVFEPGKFMTANAGVGLMKVVSRKQLPKKKIIVTDGSTYAFVPDVMIYHCYYDILPATRMDQRRTRVYNIAGCTCDSIDVIGKNRWLPKMHEGDLLAIMDIGAYSNVMASNFNSIKRAPMVMVAMDGSTKLIKRGDRYSEMFAPELDVLKLADSKELLELYHLRTTIEKIWRGEKKKKNAKRKKTKKS